MKNFFNYIALVFLTICLSGCYPTGEQSFENVSPEELSLSAENITAGNEHLSIFAKLPESIPDEVPKIRVSVREWDADSLKEMFIGDRDDLEHYEYPSDFFADENYHVYMSGENSDREPYWLIYEAGRLTSEIRENIYGCGSLSSALFTYNFDDFFNDDRLELFTKADAVNRTNTLLTRLGITNCSEPYVYAITADKANKYLADQFAEANYKKWTADDEIYILSYPLEYDGIPVTMNFSSSGEIGGHGSFFVGSYINVIVTKDKILSLSCQNILSPDYERGETVSINCNAQNALKIAAEYYDSIVLEDYDIKILNCRLVYVPFEQHDEKDFTLIPMWKIDASIDRHDSALMCACDYLFIDAQTGNIIIW